MPRPVTEQPAAAEPRCRVAGGAGGGQLRRLIASALIAGALSVGAWHASGAWFRDSARQRAADAAASLQLCLLGRGRPAGERPSRRLRAIESALAARTDEPRDGSGWPSACLVHASALDRALRAPTLQSSLGTLPPAVAIVRARPPSRRGAALDVLLDALTRAKLPAGHPAAAIAEPPSGPPDASRQLVLSTLGRAAPDHWAVHRDADGGLRLLLTAPTPQLCTFGAEDRASPSAACDRLPLPLARAGGLRLGGSEPGAATLVYGVTDGRDGFYDAASGLRVWRPRDAQAQAAVQRDGTTLVLYAEPGRDPAAAARAHRRLVVLRPGRAPTNRRLKASPQTGMLLLARALVGWMQRPAATNGAREIWVRRYDERKGRLEPRRAIGALDRAGRLSRRATCVHRQTIAVLFATTAGGAEAKLLLGRNGAPDVVVQVASELAAGALSCHADHVRLTRWAKGKITTQRCTSAGCAPPRQAPLAGSNRETQTVAPLDDRLAMVRVTGGDTLQVRVATLEALDRTAGRRWQLSTERGAGLAVRSVRLLSAGRNAWLLLGDGAEQLYAAQLGADGSLRAARIATEPSGP